MRLYVSANDFLAKIGFVTVSLSTAPVFIMEKDLHNMNDNAARLTKTSPYQHNNESVKHETQSPLASMTHAANAVLEGSGSAAGRPSDSSSASLTFHQAGAQARDHQDTGGQTVLIDEETRKLENKARQCVLEAIKAQKTQQQLIAQDAFRAREKRASRRLTGEPPKPAQRLSFVPVEQWADALLLGKPKASNLSDEQTAFTRSDASLRTQAHEDPQEERAVSPVTLRKKKPVLRPRLSTPAPLPSRPFPQPRQLHEISPRPLQKTVSLKTESGVEKTSLTTPLPPSFQSALSQGIMPGNLEELKKAFLSILDTRKMEVKDFDNLRINYIDNLDLILQEKKDAMTKMIEFLQKGKIYQNEAIQLNAMIRILLIAKDISGFFQAIANDTEVLMALDGWPVFKDEDPLCSRLIKYV